MAFRKFIKSVLLGIPIGVTFLDCVGYVARVDGISMQPALNPDASQTDYVFLSRWAVRTCHVDRGDIVSLISPKDPTQKIIKRIVGLQGDVVSTLGYKHEIVRIPEGHCWVEGDHTGHSLDSNTFGPVAQGLLTARATFIVWPPERWRRLQTELPRRRRPIQIAKSASYYSQ
ncbi:mitochondrial inner membrane protease subunit 2 [Bactrocera neohumeralis]|uniref:mitochondrial inner membrane protease subunit 2 n=1 Tax=Bactrocera tryoni TaxID=59916 RepID=UPI001A96B99B|nr:mitochondrial inner membrane protease subunit 2 [Bactrocera tryoni]XP_039969425.1 mitochondrial inner membrane protease subunit 2 [Bactrocera tryoni]XP_050322332.1 mitochondrial inner membrane protease subunit 2 [Bactrocera neohumeralis]XP_050322333.1 mitochondrial inner membrane protease subunit 2 [Bactrocera neohumeralis]